MKRILIFLIFMVAASGAAFSQSTNLKLPTSNASSNFTVTNSSSDTLMHVTGNGRIGIATSNPSQALEVKGKIVSDSGYVFPDGTTQTTAAVTSSKAYGYIYQQNPGLSVAGGTDFTFSNNGPLSGISHISGSSGIVVSSNGEYKIEFTASYSTTNYASIGIVVNGSFVPGTPYTVPEPGEITLIAILNLSAGDVITIRNNSNTFADMVDNASIVITQL